MTATAKTLAVPVDTTDVAEPPPFGPVSVADVDRRHCRWPLDDPRGVSTFRYCGERRVSGFPYCEAHVRLAYDAPSKRLRPMAAWE